MDDERRRNGRKVEVPAGAVYALLAALALICVTVLAVVLGYDGGSGGPRDDIDTGPDVKSPHLYIENVFFTGLESDDLQVTMTVYVTNDGTMEAKGVAIHAWPVVENNNHATQMTQFDLGDIGVNETEIKQGNLKLEAGTVHSVELLIFESGRIILKGRAEVSTEGIGGSSYTNTEVRGSSEDSDYDGIPDAWERYHGLDPSDPRDASRDYDDDGLTNLEEYHMNRDPNINPADTEYGSGSIVEEALDGDSDSSTLIGVFLFAVMIAAAVGVLVFAAAWIRSRRDRDDADDKAETEIRDPRPEERSPFPRQVVEGHDDSEEVDPFLFGMTEDGKRIESVKEREE
ncbi:MAG: hypothetical protein ACMUIG_04575 [Thermoplasmatota archaeon]